MKRFLCTWAEEPGLIGIGIDSLPTDALRRSYGRASPVLPAVRDGVPASLAKSGAVLFLVPKRASMMLARLINDSNPNVAQQTYLTHGHASAVVLCSSVAAAEHLVSQVGDDLLAYELWPYEDGLVRVADISAAEPECVAEWEHPVPVSTEGLGPESAAQLEQFNANLMLLAQVACRYAPEVAPLLKWLRTSINDIADELRSLTATAPENDAAVRRSVAWEIVLVEANAVISLYCSQLGSGRLPLRWADFPVGEYSFLGIGGMVRAAWRIYSHLNSVFSQFDHQGLVQRYYTASPAFDAFAASGRLDYSAWKNSPSSFANLADGRSDGIRLHVPYFSSRWGFHESLHAVSLSWQCLHASATKESNLLTVTHEFLHAHVRDILHQLLDAREPALVPNLLARYNARESGSNALEAMQVAYVEALVGLHGCIRLSQRVTNASVGDVAEELPTNLDDAALSRLVRAHSGLVHEIVVHVLDFFYIYDGRDAEYVNSIWSSWSLVPAVNDKIDHYVLRTLCALASTSIAQDPRAIFDDAVGRLRTHLEPLRERPRVRPAIQKALSLLDDPTARKRLLVQFPGVRYVVELAVNFFVDQRLHSALVRDDNTTVRDGRRTYATQVGDYRGDDIASPIGFLLDRFGDYVDQAGSDEAEYASLWQMLQLT